MKFKDFFEEIISSILANKLRSGLTILGIIIGITSVIVMIALGGGVRWQIESQIQSLGSNLVMVLPGAQRTFSAIAAARGTAQTLTIEDYYAIEKKVPDISRIGAAVLRNYQVVAKNKNTRTQVVGVTALLPQIRNFQIELGSYFTERDIQNKNRVAILGPIVKDDLFDKGTNPIGQFIKINGINFKVIGVTKPKGGMTVAEDDFVFIPLSVAQTFFTGNNYISVIIIEAKDSRTIEQIKQNITTLLMSRHNIKNPEAIDFTIMTQQDILQMATSITQVLTLFLSSIASISLIVGGIGIMNMMFTSVTERTKEIGLRKAVGAKNKDISLQFLGESVVLTLIGGVIGIILGIVISFLISNVFNIETKISLFPILLSFGVCSLIGIIFGYWPAKRASKLDPIEALRYE